MAIFRARQLTFPLYWFCHTFTGSYYNRTKWPLSKCASTIRAVENAALPLIQCIDTRSNKTQEGLSEPSSRHWISALQKNIKARFLSIDVATHPVLLCKSWPWTAIFSVAPVA